jgi:hypothetical protein
MESKMVRVPFLRLGADTAAQMNICAITVVKQKCTKSLPFLVLRGGQIGI